ncbi:helix-turn-helix domain-containing protein [Pseudonocardia sp. NPDC046786]|uniref:TetR/AcrR family transcriptional regulator n=1 Tax=Pseudonocardia sp. NPDC046786 TaxID=3155471 RepID=UPI0033D47727
MLVDAEWTDAVGIDRILEESGVAKGSLYYNFSGKAELVTEYYLRQHARWVGRIADAAQRQEHPRSTTLAIFDELGTIFTEPDFRGCALNNSSADTRSGSPKDLAVRKFRSWLHALFREPVTELGVDDPDQLVAQLVLLLDGANVAANSGSTRTAAGCAKAIAEAILPG